MFSKKMLITLSQSIMAPILLFLKNTIPLDAVCQSFCNVPSPWIELESHICYENKGKSPATITFKEDCNLYALRLQHLSGSLKCGLKLESRWGCIGNTDIFTFIISDQKTRRIWFPEGIKSVWDAEYKIDGFYSEDDVVVVKKRSNFTVGDKLQVWERESWFNTSQGDNAGRHCISLDVSCLV